MRDGTILPRSDTKRCSSLRPCSRSLAHADPRTGTICAGGKTADATVGGRHARRDPRDRRHESRRSCFASFGFGGCAIAAIAIEPTAALALTLFATRTRLHHRRRPFFERFDVYGQVTQHVLVDAHVALELVHRGRRRVEIEEDVMALAVLLDAVGEVAQTPVFAFGDLATMLGDEIGEGLGQGFDLGGRNILTRNKDVFVERHPSSLWLFAARRWSRIEHQPPGPSRQSRQGGGGLYSKIASAQAAKRSGIRPFCAGCGRARP